jgi:hypothetical protein
MEDDDQNPEPYSLLCSPMSVKPHASHQGQPGLDDYDDEAPEEDAEVASVVYILEGSHPEMPYASKALWEMERS